MRQLLTIAITSANTGTDNEVAELDCGGHSYGTAYGEGLSLSEE